MPRRSLPSPEEARRILAAKRTRPPRRPAPTLGRSLTPFIKALDERFGQGAGGLKARWREIVGETLAKRSEPAKLAKGRAGTGAVLEIKVEGPMATLVQHQSADILARVNLFLGDGAVARLRIVQGPVASARGPDAAAPPRRPRVRPLDAAAEAELSQSVQEVVDPKLRVRLERLGRAVLGREPPRAFPGPNEPGNAPASSDGARPGPRTGSQFAGTRSGR